MGYIFYDFGKLFGREGLLDLFVVLVRAVFEIIEAFNPKIGRNDGDFDLVECAGSRTTRNDASRKPSADVGPDREGNIGEGL